MTTPSAASLLRPDHLLHLRDDSAISEAVIDMRPYRTVMSKHEWRQFAPHLIVDRVLNSVLHKGGIAFPLHRLGEAQPFTWVLRPDLPRTDSRGRSIKYEYPAGVGNTLDVLPQYRVALGDPNIP